MIPSLPIIIRSCLCTVTLPIKILPSNRYWQIFDSTQYPNTNIILTLLNWLIDVLIRLGASVQQERHSGSSVVEVGLRRICTRCCIDQ